MRWIKSNSSRFPIVFLSLSVDAGGNRIYWHIGTDTHSHTYVTLHFTCRNVWHATVTCVCAPLGLIAIFSHHQQTVKNGFFWLTITPFLARFGDGRNVVRSELMENAKDTERTQARMRRDNPMAKLMLADCSKQNVCVCESTNPMDGRTEPEEWKMNVGLCLKIVFEIRNWFAWIGHVM